MARPSKPHHQSWNNKPVAGLYKCPDGRWRVNATGQKFTEPDERRAVAKFRQIEAKLASNERITIPVATVADATEAAQGMVRAARNEVAVLIPRNVEEGFTVSASYDAAPVWAWLRRELIERPDYVADRVGIPELAGLARFDLPKASIRLSHLKDLYSTKADVKPESKREACKTFQRFLDITEAKTLDDLSTERLVKYRDAVRDTIASPGTIAAYFGRAKWIIAFGKTEGEDAKQIDAALSRMSILKAPKDNRVHKPSPVAPADFCRLLTTAQEQFPDWHARLMVMINCCLHFDEALDVEWADFDMGKETFCTHRNKRGRVIRAATLWPETVAALKSVKRTDSPYVFVSAHGSRFNAKGQWKTWQRIRTIAGCKTVQMDDIRDGAYTAACNAIGIDEKLARLLAGHRSHGLQDNYVSRHPAIVRPACDAVRTHYFSSPT